MTQAKLFLLAATFGLIPIALGYGLMPEKSLLYLYGVSIEGTSHTHIMRAVMGLYLAMALFWFMGARAERLQTPAIMSLVVFMLGLAAGRILSLAIDGMPHPLLAIYTLLEIVFGVLGLMLLRNECSGTCVQSAASK